ncbi:MAG: FAD/NAD(P)-binding protein [Acidimicrobiia bacterium]|nr:FAD/NAD(P)-binding protein [Acidimicrobiia bacterium]
MTGAPLTELGAGPMTPTMYRVSARADESPQTVTLDLSPMADPIGVPAPGQFTMLWSFGIGEAPISVAAAAVDGSLRQTIRGVGPVTSALCAAVAGDLVGVRGPYGVGWDLDLAQGRDVLIVGGGLGVAPVRSAIEHILENRGRFGRLAVVIGARTPDALLYPRELARWQERSDVDLEVTVDTATVGWRGNVGLVTQLLDRATVDLGTAVAFVCGPEVMMRFVARGLLERGAPPENIFVSLERNMHCAIGHCGHCQLGPLFVCKDGPVHPWHRVAPLLSVREL